ncbi:hydantoinase/oxoprolinase family protein [Natrarchaeobius chitinivorans]|uniref:Hydantoinase/oxoprolinase family protein n=1 Tax=Natrarchaeobius chitinivorans TaxID=1679083 RepID=A0A3N6NA28_NATCH|nr:hydantoinase/oxoprolinase family protein [Natrarchaeobius chitinivorans]RQG95432.1 hydantoinase/oxoprolinase family protein [Natrarchaeobius chitinivorans]
MTFQLASDIGGTFTDLFVCDEEGVTNSYKSPTTHGDLPDGLLTAIEKAAVDHGLSLEEFLQRTDRFVHGTTVSTNAIIEGETDTTGLIVTEGFKDVLWLRDGGKEDPYDWDRDYPDPFVPRALTVGVDERINAEGECVTPLDEAEARSAVERLADRDDVEAIAVSLLWAHVEPRHERRIGEIIEDVAPKIPYSLSHEVNPVIREYRRTSSTAINASLTRIASSYLADLERRLNDRGFEEELLVITANGGVLDPSEVRETPIWTVDSGPTMLPVAAAEMTEAELGRTDAIAVDMGGTSIDIGVVDDGVIPRTRDATVGDDYLLGIEKIDVTSVGAGGGSIAWVDEGRFLHVGPQSAGSVPGPACYQRGGTDPTVTDAALVLGYLNEEYFLGGTMDVDRSAAREAIRDEVAEPLDVDVGSAAHAIYAGAMQESVNGIEELTIERGIDPRNYVLFGGGGTFGLFAVGIAREMQANSVFLPREAGVVSSVGGILSDVRRDFTASQFGRSDQFDFDNVNDVLTTLRSDAEAFLDRMNVADSNRSRTGFVSARYPEQIWELEVELPVERITSENLDALVEQFHEKHKDVYGFRMEQDVEFLDWRIEAVGKVDAGKGVVSGGEPTSDPVTPHAQRNAYFDGGTVECAVYRASALRHSDVITGPAILEAENTTVVLPPESELSVTTGGNYRITP